MSHIALSGKQSHGSHCELLYKKVVFIFANIFYLLCNKFKVRNRLGNCDYVVMARLGKKRRKKILAMQNSEYGPVLLELVSKELNHFL
jgi:hypothetical protein